MVAYHLFFISLKNTNWGKAVSRSGQVQVKVILIVHRLALHQNGVEFLQQFNGAIRTSLTAMYDDVLAWGKAVSRSGHVQAKVSLIVKSEHLLHLNIGSISSLY